MVPALLFSTGGTVMSYDRFEEDWFDIPEPEEDENSPSGKLPDKPKNDPPPEPAPKDKSRYVPSQYRKRQRLKRRRHSSVLLAASGRLRRDN